MIPPICLFCKTFRRDLDVFENLLLSVERYNSDNIPFVVSVPERDYAIFESRLGKGRIDLVSDEHILNAKLPDGWRMQQVVKLHFWKMNKAKNAIMLDADFYFVRPFTRQDFLEEDGVPKFVVSRRTHCYTTTDNELHRYIFGTSKLVPLTEADCRIWRPGTHTFPSIPRFRFLRDKLIKTPVRSLQGRIHATFRPGGPKFHFMPGPIWNHATLAHLYEEFMKPRRLDYIDLIRYSPWEYHWYAEYAIASECQALRPIEPQFLHFATENTVVHARSQGVTDALVAHRYLGVAMAANHHPIAKL